MLTLLLIQLGLGHLGKLSPLFEHVALCSPAYSPFTVLVPIPVGTESSHGYDARREEKAVLNILTLGVHSLVSQFCWKSWCSCIHMFPVKKNAQALGRGLHMGEVSSLSTAETATVTIRKWTNHLESSLHSAVTPVSLGCLFVLPLC